MKELKIADDAILDDVVEELIKEREKGNHVCVNFDGVMLYSDDVTLESAYKAVWNWTPEEFYYQTEGGKAHNGMRKLFEVSKENVLRHVKMSRIFSLTKDGKLYCSMADEYIENMEKYAQYCVPKKQQKWKTLMHKTVYGAGQLSDNTYLTYLTAFELVGKIMEAHANGKTWEEIEEMVEAAEADEEVLLYIQVMLDDYSSIGDEYCANVNVEPKKTTSM